jgi:hypothetical protein
MNYCLLALSAYPLDCANITELHGGRLAFAARASLTRCHCVNADRRLISDRFGNLVRTSPGGPDPPQSGPGAGQVPSSTMSAYGTKRTLAPCIDIA